MTLPWSPQQIEWLQAMGLDVLRRDAPPAVAAPAVQPATVQSSPEPVPAALARAARGADLSMLLASHGIPRDAASRRAFWRALRPLRKAARTP